MIKALPWTTRRRERRAVAEYRASWRRLAKMRKRPQQTAAEPEPTTGAADGSRHEKPY